MFLISENRICTNTQILLHKFDSKHPCSTPLNILQDVLQDFTHTAKDYNYSFLKISIYFLVKN